MEDGEPQRPADRKDLLIRFGAAALPKSKKLLIRQPGCLLQDPMFMQVWRTVAAVDGNRNSEFRALGRQQPRVAACLVVNVKSGTQERGYDFLRREHREARHGFITM